MWNSSSNVNLAAYVKNSEINTITQNIVQTQLSSIDYVENSELTTALQPLATDNDL